MRAVVLTGLLCLAAGPHLARAGDEARLPAPLQRDGDKALLDFFRRNTLTPADLDRIGLLIAQLDAQSYKQREKATAALVAEGPRALPLIRRALARATLEQRMRLGKCLKALDDPDLARDAAAALCRTRDRRPDGAVGVLLAYAPYAPEDAVPELLDALCRTAGAGGELEAELFTALADPEPARRGAAAMVVAALGNTEQRAQARRLLDDPEPVVRFRTATGLLAVRDPAGVPALIALLPAGDLDLADVAAGLLAAIAGDTAPKAPLGNDAAGRAKCHTAWLAWWEQARADLDLARAALEWQHLLGAAVRLEGTVWTGVDLPEKYFTTYRFEKNGKLVWSYNGGKFTNGTWKQEGRTLTFQMNNNYRESRGTIKGNTIEFDSWNVRGVRWFTVITRVERPGN
jgi:hypothetical protein